MFQEHAMRSTTHRLGSSIGLSTYHEETNSREEDLATIASKVEFITNFARLHLPLATPENVAPQFVNTTKATNRMHRHSMLGESQFSLRASSKDMSPNRGASIQRCNMGKVAH